MLRDWPQLFTVELLSTPVLCHAPNGPSPCHVQSHHTDVCSSSRPPSLSLLLGCVRVLRFVHSLSRCASHSTLYSPLNPHLNTRPHSYSLPSLPPSSVRSANHSRSWTCSKKRRESPIRSRATSSLRSPNRHEKHDDHDLQSSIIVLKAHIVLRDRST
jgi:hypothetical protein